MARYCSHETSFAKPPAEDNNVLASELAGQQELVGIQEIRALSVAHAVYETWPRGLCEPRREDSTSPRIIIIFASLQVLQHSRRACNIGFALEILCECIVQTNQALPTRHSQERQT